MSSIRILIIRLSSMGDVILQTSLVELLKEQHGDKVEVTFLTSKEFESLLTGHPHINQVLTFDRKMQKTKALIEIVNSEHKKKNFDLIIDLHNTLRSTIIRWRFFYIPSLAVDKRRLERILITKFKINLLKPFHGKAQVQLERILFDFSGILHLNYHRHRLSSYIDREVNYANPDEAPISSTAYSYTKKDVIYNPEQKWQKKQYICLLPSSAHANKRWPEEHFISFTKIFLNSSEGKNKKVLILAGKEDTFCRAFDVLEKEFPDRVYNLQGKCNLLESSLLTRDALFCVGNDTGLVHVAESFSTPSVVLFGPTTEDFGFYPHLKNSKTISLQMWCRPCSTTGKNKCFRKERYCMTHITPQAVMDEVKELC
ncbi:MAG: glycosyltransferase family 9 protein [Bacteriovoracaceae bacterium]|nr:glycosyltransferase family 9 protein [Bacteriovoracaceae bacterium]